jgi:hypothetical protein
MKKSSSSVFLQNNFLKNSQNKQKSSIQQQSNTSIEARHMSISQNKSYTSQKILSPGSNLNTNSMKNESIGSSNISPKRGMQRDKSEQNLRIKSSIEKITNNMISEKRLNFFKSQNKEPTQNTLYKPTSFRNKLQDKSADSKKKFSECKEKEPQKVSSISSIPINKNKPKSVSILSSK